MTPKQALSRPERRVIPDRRASAVRAQKRLEDALASLDKAFETYEGAKGEGELTYALEREVIGLLKKARKAVDDAIMTWAGRMR